MADPFNPTTPILPTGTAGTTVQNQAGQTIGGYDSSGNLANFATTADNLMNPPKLAVVPPAPQVTQPSTFVNNLQPAVQQANNGLIQANTQEAAQRGDVLSNLLRLQDPNSQSTYDSKFGALGGNDYLKQFTDANTRLAQLQGVFNTGSQKVSSAPGQSQVFEGLQLNEINRQKAVEVGNQALVVQAMQGNIETARQIALDTSNFATQDRAAKLQSLSTQFSALDGIVQGQEKQLIDQAKVKADADLKKLERAQTYIDSAISSGDATPEEMQKLIDPKLSDEQKMSFAAGVINRSAAAKTAFERSQGKYSVVGTGEVDEWGNEKKAVFNTQTGKFSSIGSTPNGSADFTNAVGPQDGTVGGQCAVFAEKISDFGTPGNKLGYGLKEKQATVDKYGVTAAEFKSDPQIGDGIIFNIGKYGHVSVVTAVNGDGTVTVKDSNYGLDEKVQTRTVSLSDGTIYGAVHGTLKGIQTTNQDSPAQNGSVSTADLINGFKSASLNMPAQQQKGAMAQFKQLVTSGNIEGAKEYITRTAIASAPVEQQNQAQGRMEALASLDVIKSSLADYQAAGGNTNVFTGTEEQIANKVGATKDPKLAYLANQIQQAFINYRRSMTGVAFSPAESKQYEQLFPSIGKLDNFNQATIKSLQDTMNRNQEVFLKNRIGAQAYNSIYGGGSSSTQADNSPESQYLASLMGGGGSTATAQQSGGQDYKINFAPIAKSIASNLIAPLVMPGKTITDAYSYIKSLFN